MRSIVCAALLAASLAGCSSEPPPAPPEPKLESKDPAERTQAARRAAEKFGAPEDEAPSPGDDKNTNKPSEKSP